MGWYDTKKLITLATLVKNYIYNKDVNVKDSILHHVVFVGIDEKQVLGEQILKSL